MNDTFFFILLYFLQLRDIILTTRGKSPSDLDVFLGPILQLKIMQTFFVYLLQKGNFLLGWLMECLLLELGEINQMAAGNTHLLPLMLIKNN